MAKGGCDGPAFELFRAFLNSEWESPEHEESIVALGQLLAMKKENEERELTIEGLESLSAQLQDANTRMAEGTLGPSAFIDHPLFGLALEAHFKKHPPGDATPKAAGAPKAAAGAPKATGAQKAAKAEAAEAAGAPKAAGARKSRPSYVCLHGGARTRARCRKDNIQMDDTKTKNYTKCLLKCGFADYSDAKMKAHYKKKHDIDLGDTPLPVHPLQLTPVEARRTTGKTHKCVSCTKSFDSDAELSFHTRSIHVPDSFKKYECHCGQKFVLKMDLKDHTTSCKPE